LATLGRLQQFTRNLNERLVLTRALDKARDDEVLAIPDLADTSWSTRQADAFVNMVGEYLSGDHSNGHSNDNYLVTVHVDQSALASGQGQ